MRLRAEHPRERLRTIPLANAPCTTSDAGQRRKWVSIASTNLGHCIEMYITTARETRWKPWQRREAAPDIARCNTRECDRPCVTVLGAHPGQRNSRGGPGGRGTHPGHYRFPGQCGERSSFGRPGTVQVHPGTLVALMSPAAGGQFWLVFSERRTVIFLKIP